MDSLARRAIGRVVSPCVLLVWLLIGSAGALLADGTQTGTLIGSVVDSGGLPLPQVEIELIGAQERRAGLTDDQGRFRFPGLEIGSYIVKADLLGLIAEQQVRVYTDTTTDVALELVEGSVSSDFLPVNRDLIRVQAVAPLIDPFETRVGASVSRQFLDELPVTRFYQSVALLLPGLTGGSDGNPNVGGALRNANLYLVDGADTSDPTTGLFGLNLTYEAIEEVGVTTAALPTEYGRVSGAIINVVTRSGSDEFEGSFRWLVTNGDWNGDYDDAAPTIARDVEVANDAPDRFDSTFSATLGGPLQPGKLWFFGAFEQASESLQRPTEEGTVWNEEPSLEGNTLKIDWQPTSMNSLVAQFAGDAATFNDFAPFDRTAGENRAARSFEGADLFTVSGDIFALTEREQRGQFSTVQWNGVLTPNFSLAATLAVQDRRLTRRPLNSRGFAGDAPHLSFVFDGITDGFFVFQSETIFNGITDHGFEERERRQANFSGEWFRAGSRIDQEFRFGIDYQETFSESRLDFAGRNLLDPQTGNHSSGQLFWDIDTSDECFSATPDCRPGFDPAALDFTPLWLDIYWTRPLLGTEATTTAAYFEDSLTFDRWVVSLGLRYERYEGESRDGRLLIAEDEGWSPRVGVKFDPKGDGNVFLSATYSRLIEPFDQALLDSYVLQDPFSGVSFYTWGGAFGGDVFGVDCSDADPSDITSECWLPDGTQDFFGFRADAPNLGLRRSHVDELVLGFERQLTASTAVRLNYVDRRWVDLFDDLFEFTDTEPFFVDGVQNLNQARREYRGFQLLLQKRFADNWQMLASYTWSETEGNLFRRDALAPFADLQSETDDFVVNRFGPAPYDSGSQGKVFFNYQIPIGRTNLSFGSAAIYEEGKPFQQVDNGRFLTPRGSERLDDFFQWDVSAAIDVPLPEDFSLRVKLEVFNLTDSSTRFAVEDEIDSEAFALPLGLNDLQRPRSIRLSLGLDF